MINIYTDGAHSSSTNVGGWSYVFTLGGTIYMHSGYELDTTNNRMELLAVLKALKHIQSLNTDAIIYTDSAYIANCFAQNWYVKWRNNGWLTSKKTAVLNKDLWENILSAYEELNIDRNVKIQKVSGHAGDKLNELADYHAVQARIQGAKENEKQTT